MRAGVDTGRTARGTRLQILLLITVSKEDNFVHTTLPLFLKIHEAVVFVLAYGKYPTQGVYHERTHTAGILGIYDKFGPFVRCIHSLLSSRCLNGK